MPKQQPTCRHRAGRGAARRSVAARAGIVAWSSLALAAGTARAVTPLSTYFGPGLPLDSYFPEGIPGSQDEQGVTVLSRARPGYDPLGIRVGAFMVRPSIDETAGYNSDVLGGLSSAKGSSELESAGNVSVNSNYTSDNFGLTGGIDNTEYWDVPRMTHTDYNASFGGGINLGSDELDLSASYRSANEEPYDIGTNGTSLVQLVKPLNFQIADFRASYASQFGRFSVRPNVDYELLRFARGDFSGISADQAETFDQSRRDVNIIQGGVIVQYQFQPQRSIVVVLNGNDDHYTGGNQPAIGAVDSTGATVLGGIDYQLTGATTIRALVGYQERFFAGSRYGNQGAPIAEADVIWNPTGLTTVTARYSRTIEEATTISVTGYTYDRFSLIVDHELYRNILLQGNLRLENADYQSSTQQQRNYGGGVGVTYLINRNVQAALSYQFIQRENSGGQQVSAATAEAFGGNPSRNFAQHLVLLHFKFGI